MKISACVICILFKLSSNTISATVLCDDSKLDAATRLNDGQIVLFKGNYFWYLQGMPATQGSLSDSDLIKNKWPKMASSPNAVMTVTEGNGLYKNVTYAFNGRYWDSFNSNGGHLQRQYWAAIPEKGFTATLHNANKENPLFVAFDGHNVTNFKTSGFYFQKIDNKKSNFPIDIDAAFGLPDGTIYLFKGTQYCKSQFESTVECTEWKHNKELFGCYKITASPENNISSHVTANSEQLVSTEENESTEENDVTRQDSATPASALNKAIGSNTSPLIYIAAFLLLLFMSLKS